MILFFLKITPIILETFMDTKLTGLRCKMLNFWIALYWWFGNSFSWWRKILRFSNYTLACIFHAWLLVMS